MIDWMKSRLVPNIGEDDLLLEIVVFVGTCASDESAAIFLCKCEVLPALIELLKAKQEDDEIVLQVVQVVLQVVQVVLQVVRVVIQVVQVVLCR